MGMPAQPKVLIFENSHILTNYLLKLWQTIAQQSVADHNQFNAALSGGRTPAEFYCRLSTLADDALWQKTHLFLGDEHFVPADHKDNNFQMIKANLVDYIHIPQGHVHGIPTDVDNAAVAAEHFKHELIGHFSYQRKPLPTFDLVLLGVGEDGHTASLFQGINNISDPKVVTVPVSLPHLKNDRVSISLSVINNAHYVIFLVLGKHKSDIMHEILEKNFVCPASQVNPAHGELIFLLDKEAARKLSQSFIHAHEQDAFSLIHE